MWTNIQCQVSIYKTVFCVFCFVFCAGDTVQMVPKVQNPNLTPSSSKPQSTCVCTCNLRSTTTSRGPLADNSILPQSAAKKQSTSTRLGKEDYSNNCCDNNPGHAWAPKASTQTPWRDVRRLGSATKLQTEWDIESKAFREEKVEDRSWQKESWSREGRSKEKQEERSWVRSVRAWEWPCSGSRMSRILGYGNKYSTICFNT